MVVIKEAVYSLDELDITFGPALIGLGRRHPVGVRFTTEYNVLFIQTVLSVWKSVLRDKMTTEATIAWHILFEYILIHLKQGRSTRKLDPHYNMQGKKYSEKPNID